MEDIKKGYKQTDIGVIPEDWEARSLGSIITKTQLGGNYPNHGIQNDTPLIKMGNLNRGYINLEKVQYIKSTSKSSEQDKLYFGDLLFNTRNTLDLVGKVAIWRNELNNAYFNSNIMRIKFNEKYISTNFFMNLVLNTKQTVEQLRGIAIGTTSVAAIYNRDLFTLQIVLPTKEEQTAIATVLSDTDALIAALDKKIAKKQQIKQGAMQQLLTGKKRLPGFNGEWVEKKLGAIGKTYGGLTGKTKDDFGNGDSYYITFLNILNNPVINTDLIERIRIKSTEHQNKALKNDLFFNTSSETPEEVGICSVLLNDIENLYLNSFCFGYRINDNEVHGLFLSYLFRSKQGRELMTSLAQGATRYNLSKSLFNQSLIKMPATKTEQTAIAQILTDIDNEIAQLEKERDKYKEMKAGMMQVLLTGKIRLI